MSRGWTFVRNLTLAFLTGCATLVPPLVRNPPFRIDPDASVIIAKFVLIAPVGLENVAQRIYFARLNPDNQHGKISLEGAEFYPSTYLSGGHVHFLDAPPGQYVAVCANALRYGRHMDFDSSERVKRDVSVLKNPWAHYSPGMTTFFDDSVIAASLITVEPSTTVYMGEFYVRQGLDLSKAALNQRYTALFVAPSVFSFDPSPMTPTPYYLARLEKRSDTEQSRAGAIAEFKSRREGIR